MWGRTLELDYYNVQRYNYLGIIKPYYSQKHCNKKGFTKMKTTELEIMKSMTKKAVEECDDLELLDLVYKIIVTSQDNLK